MSERRDWQLGSHLAAPGEHVLLPSVASTLFPLQSAASRMVYRIALCVVLATMVGAAALRMPGLLIATVALGIPLLFAQYVGQLRVNRSQRARLAAAAVLGIAGGTAFALLTGALASETYGVPFGNGVAAVHLRAVDVEVSAAAALLVMLPAVIIRVCAPGKREALSGYLIGAAGGLGVAMASTVVHMFAQLSSGLVDHDEPLSDLLIEAGIRGVTAPVTAAATAGLVGAALWFSAGQGARPVRWILASAGLLLAMTETWLGGLDTTVLSQWTKVLGHCVVAAVAVLVLRIGLHMALLREQETGGVERPVAGRAASIVRVVTIWTVVIAVFATGLVGLAALIAKPTERYLCPPNCGRPLRGQPVAANPLFTAADGAFTVSYPAPGTAYTVTTDHDGVTALFTGGDGGMMRLFGRPAAGRNAKEVATELVRHWYPDSQVAYELPNTMVGYRAGYGVAIDDWPDGNNVAAARSRVLIMVAVKDDLALIAAAAGPYRELDSGSGPPTGASLELAEDMGKYVNSFRWRGDPVR